MVGHPGPEREKRSLEGVTVRDRLVWRGRTTPALYFRSSVPHTSDPTVTVGLSRNFGGWERDVVDDDRRHLVSCSLCGKPKDFVGRYNFRSAKQNNSTTY